MQYLGELGGDFGGPYDDYDYWQQQQQLLVITSKLLCDCSVIVFTFCCHRLHPPQMILSSLATEYQVDSYSTGRQTYLLVGGGVHSSRSRRGH